MVQSTTEQVTETIWTLVESETIKILHVDDEPSILKVTRACLEMKGGFQVDSVASVKEAWKKLKMGKFDVVVSDYKMPKKDGLELLKELRTRNNNIPFIMFTGQGREEVAIQALNLGADQYLNKTGDPETVYGELAHSVRKAVNIRQVEEKARKQREFNYGLLKRLKEGFAAVDKDGTQILSNDELCKMTGYSEEELTNQRPPFKYWAEEGIEEINEAFEKTLRGIEGEYELIFKRKDGERFTALVSPRSHIDPDGNTIFFATIKDITERKKAERALRENQEKFERLFKNNPEAADYLDNNSRVLDVNLRFEELFGYSRDEILGKRINEILVPKGKMEEAEMLDKNAEKGYVYYETSRKRKDNSLIPVAISAAPIILNGRLIGTVGLYKDLSKLKRTEKALKKTLKKLGVTNEKLRVVGRFSRHDVRNKLAVIFGNVHLIKKALAGDPEHMTYLTEIESTCEEAIAILNFTETYEKLGLEKLVYIDVEKTVEHALSLFPELHNLKVLNECHGLTVLADSLLQQLFYNLIDNSLKHGENVSHIKVNYKDGKEGLRLAYEDDGIGIPEDEKGNIFKEDYGKGTGHGLYLIKQMCEVYSWTIKETSKEGKGAQFAITIPKMNENGKRNYQFQKI